MPGAEACASGSPRRRGLPFGGGATIAAKRQDAEIAAFVRQRLPLAPAPGVPEIRLHHAGPGSGLVRFLGPDGASPYWAYGWAGGTVLARHLLANPEVVRGRSVLDIGTGSGLVAIAAARAGAVRVAAIDIDPVAVVAARLNAAENGMVVDVRSGDALAAPPPAGVDLITVGDLFYDRSLARRTATFLGACRRAGIAVLVGDPGRRYLPLARLKKLADDVVPDFEGGAGVPAAVFAFDPGR